MGKKGLKKSIRIYMSKLKKVPSHLNIPKSHHPAAVAGWLLSACKYPCRTPSFADVDRDGDNVDDGPTATLSDVDRFLHENFHSLYLREDAEAGRGPLPSSESPRYDEDLPPPPPAAFRWSERFFVSPGTSNSLLEEARPSGGGASSSSTSCCSSGEAVAGDGGGVAVMTFSRDPYRDFRRSMQDMVEAQQAVDWDFMEELLFCYLELNDRSVHKYILRAFVDLTVSLSRRVERGNHRKERKSRREDGGAATT